MYIFFNACSFIRIFLYSGQGMHGFLLEFHLNSYLVVFLLSHYESQYVNYFSFLYYFIYCFKPVYLSQVSQENIFRDLSCVVPLCSTFLSNNSFSSYLHNLICISEPLTYLAEKVHCNSYSLKIIGQGEPHFSEI